MSRQKYGPAALIALIIVALLGLNASAATIRRMSFDSLVQSSDYIVYGRVIGSLARFDPATQTIWTRTELLVLDGPKGRAGATLAITEPGGIADGRGEFYPGTPQFRPNQEVVLFLYRAPGNRLRVTGLLQGMYVVVDDPQRGERMAVPAAPEAEVVYEEGSPYAQTARQSAGGAETLSRFLRTIREKALTQ